MSLLQMSFSGAVFILAVVVIRALAIHKLPKKTFLVLWNIVLIRLLIPFSVPSMLSVYSLIPENTPENTWDGMQAVHSVPAAVGKPFSIWFLIWLIGAVICITFFALSYLRCLFEFRASLPVQNEFAKQWLKEHPLRRTISIRQSDKITSPLTYGIFAPVILMPKKTDWKNINSLQYVLSHEYVHICRCDTMIKLIITFALCIHWFNPMVWVMYLLFNRDIEMTCDECIVRQFGETSKSAYALMLISMETVKSGLMPLCNSFSNNAIEERIMAIMKMKKTSKSAILVAAGLTICMTAAFATSAANKTEDSGSSQNKEETIAVKQLLADSDSQDEYDPCSIKKEDTISVVSEDGKYDIVLQIKETKDNIMVEVESEERVQ